MGLEFFSAVTRNKPNLSPAKTGFTFLIDVASSCANLSTKILQRRRNKLANSKKDFINHFLKYCILRFLLGLILFGYVAFQFIKNASPNAGNTLGTQIIFILDFFFYPFSLYLISSIYSLITNRVFKYPRIHITKQTETGYYQQSNGDYIYQEREKTLTNGVFLYIIYIFLFTAHFLIFMCSTFIGIAGIILFLIQKKKIETQ